MRPSSFYLSLVDSWETAKVKILDTYVRNSEVLFVWCTRGLSGFTILQFLLLLRYPFYFLLFIIDFSSGLYLIPVDFLRGILLSSHTLQNELAYYAGLHI